VSYYPFGALAPDLNPRLNDRFLRVADGAYPAPDGYKPVGQWASSFTALAAAPKGGASFVTPQGGAVIVAGTATTLYKAHSGGWQSIATGFSIETGQRWRFAQFGGLAIATNGSNPMQKIDLGTMAVSALGGTPPKFEALGVVKGFLIGTCMDGDVMTIAWSGAFNAESWEFGYGQSDYYTLPSGGRVNGILSGEYGLILQRDRIVRLDYVGGNLIFDPNEVSSNVGCVTVHSVAQWGNLGFFLSDEGFMMWDGAQIVPIGRERIDAEFRAAYDVSDWSSMSTAIDPVRGVVMWSMGNKIYCYDWTLRSKDEAGRWSTISYSAPIIFSGVTKGLTIDEQDPGVGANDDNIDGVGLLSLDDASFAGGDPRLYVFNSSYALGTLSGTPMAATFTTNDLEVFPGQRANLSFVRPDIDAASGITVTIGTKQRLADAFSSTAFSTIETSGDMPVRSSGRYNKITAAVAAGTSWTNAKGIELFGAPGAGR
jgi:hypothetical protein